MSGIGRQDTNPARSMFSRESGAAASAPRPDTRGSRGDRIRIVPVPLHPGSDNTGKDTEQASARIVPVVF